MGLGMGVGIGLGAAEEGGDRHGEMGHLGARGEDHGLNKQAFQKNPGS